MRDLNDLTRPTVPSGAIQGRMRAKPEEPAASSAGTASGLRGPVHGRHENPFPT